MQRVRLSSQQAPVHKLGDPQMTLSPKFRLAVVQSSFSNPSSDFEFSHCQEPLIPGLPDDVAFNCLLRLPVQSHATCRAVCKRWHMLLGSKERFFTHRKQLGLKGPWLSVFAYHRCTGKIQWQVLDLTHFSWHRIPAMPCKDKVCPHGFRCISIPHEGALFVCGGMVSDVDCPLDLVVKYEMQKNRWTVMNRMITARSFFASGVIDGMIYVAGGNSADLFELDSAEVLDPLNGSWRSIASMGTNMASYDAAVLNGKLLVQYAQRFNQGFMSRYLTGKGTPMRPGPLDAYLFSLIDEDAKSIQPGNFERHWGLFYLDGKPKYPLNLGSTRGLVGASGVHHLGKRWCIMKPTANLNDDQVPPSVAYACQNADCTSLGYGTSCGNLDARGNISYAFNDYFQVMDQMESACKFSGLAVVTDRDPSTDTCKFRTMIDSVSAERLASTRTVLFVFFLFSLL